MKPALPALLVALAAVTAYAAVPRSPEASGGVPLPAPTVDAPRTAGAPVQVAYFAGGCFWGVEAVFEHLKGVQGVVSGYAGGTAARPTYEAVSAGQTGHAEAVRVVFDPAVVSYGQLLHVFFSVAHDPTQRNRQGPDVGTQYRSMVLFANDEQQRIVEDYVAQLTAAKAFPRPIVTELVKLTTFHDAEAYHQNYLESHRDQPYIVYNDLPKLANLQKEFAALYRDGVSGQ